MKIKKALQSLFKNKKEDQFHTYRNLFDDEWYKTQYPETVDIDPFEHYINTGAAKGYNPNPFFDTNYYLSQNPKLVKTGVNPLLDYVLNYSKNLKNPHPLFDTSFYLNQYEDIAENGINPLLHYIKYGIAEGRLGKPIDPLFENNRLYQKHNSILFKITHGLSQKLFNKNKNKISIQDTFSGLIDSDWYKKEYADACNTDSLKHYINFGAAKGYNPNPFFDTNYYLSQNPKTLKEGENPLLDYVLNFSKNLKNPHPLFNTSYYLDSNPDIAVDGVNPLLHYIKYGLKEGRLGKLIEPTYETKTLRQQISSVGFKSATHLTEIILNLNNVKNYINLKKYNDDEILYLNEANDAFGINKEIFYPKSTYIAKLNNILILGGSRYIIADNNQILHDEEFYFKNSKDADVKYKNAKRLENDKLKLDFRIRQAAWLNTGINLMHEYNSNYFHFIVETLPRMLLCEEIQIPNHIPFIFESNLHPNIVNLITLNNTLKRPIIYLPPDTIYSIKEMYYVSDISSIIDSYKNGEENRLSVISINSIKKIKNKFLENFPELKNKKPFRKIYVKRTGNYRSLVNQDEIEDALVKLDFEIIDTSFISIESQIKIFNEASLVITPTGAQVTNIVWCQNNVRVIILFSDHPSHQHYLWEILGKTNDLRVCIHTGLSITDNDTLHGVHNDYIVNVDNLLNLYKKIS